MNKIGILGMGEIGTAISKFYKNPLTGDRKSNNFEENMDILHICIPYSRKFNKIVLKYAKEFEPKYVIINSTVDVGTTEYLNSKSDSMFLHCPIRGVHPNLYEGIKTFKMYIGSDNYLAGEKIKEHVEKLGIKAEIVTSRESELAKLLDTTYYGICIAFHDYANKLINKEAPNSLIRFDKIMTEFNKSYNEGYIKLDKSNVVRPVLYAPEGEIGGHCIRPNAKILKKRYGNHNILKSILKVK